MELRHLRYFLAIADAGSFTEGARRLRVAQPSLTRQLRDLEVHLGSQLFLRTQRGAILTEAGKTLLPEATKAVAQFDNAIRRTQDIGRRTRRLVLGMIPGTEDALIVHVRKALGQNMQDVVIDVQSRVPPELIKALESGTIEAAFIRHGDVGQRWATKTVRTEALVAILPTRHRLARKRTLAPADFSEEAFVAVASAAAPAFRAAVDRFLGQGTRHEAAPWRETDTMLSIFSIVAATGSCSLVPSYFSSMLPKGLVARPLRTVCEPDLKLVLAYSADRVSSALQALLQKTS